MKRTFDSFEVIKAMAESGNPNSVSDAGVGALAARSAVLGAFLNVKINAAGLEDKDYASRVLAEGRALKHLPFVTKRRFWILSTRRSNCRGLGA